MSLGVGALNPTVNSSEIRPTRKEEGNGWWRKPRNQAILSPVPSLPSKLESQREQFALS